MGLRAVEWLLTIQTAEAGHLSLIGDLGGWPRGGVRATADQRPIEATTLLLAADAAWRATSTPRFRTGMEAAYAWFLGGNDITAMVADPVRGACHDGISADGVLPGRGTRSDPHVAHGRRGHPGASRAAREAARPHGTSSAPRWLTPPLSDDLGADQQRVTRQALDLLVHRAQHRRQRRRTAPASGTARHRTRPRPGCGWTSTMMPSAPAATPGERHRPHQPALAGRV